MTRYVDITTIKAFAEASDASPDSVWEILADSASLIFDRACDLADGFFTPASNTASNKTFLLNRTGYYFIPPYIESATITFDGETVESTDYKIDGNILFAPTLKTNSDLPDPKSFTISAKWGFSAVPADVKQAVIDQALFMFRKKDLAFAELSGVPTEAVRQQLAPTCEVVAKKYHEKYFQVSV